MANTKEITIKVQLDGTKSVVKDSAQIQHSVRDIGGEAETTGKRAQQGFGMAGIAAGALAAGALNELKDMTIETAREAFRLATEVEETASKYETVMGPAIEEANIFLDDNAALMGLSRMEGQELVATTTAIAQGFDFEGEAAADLGQEVVKLAGDMQSFNNVPIEQTHNAITSALSGETEALKSLGIVIRQEMVAQRALQQTGKESADALTQQERATATLELITERAGVAIGDLERTQDSAANRTRQMQADLRTVSEIMSTEFSGSIESTLNVLQPAVATIREWVETPMIEELQNERDEFNRLYTIATNVNTSQQERVRLIRQMKQEYPDFLEGIDAETVSNSELAGILQRVNEEYQGRINIQEVLNPVQEAYNKATKESAEAQELESEMLIDLEKMYRRNQEQLQELGFETDEFRERLANMNGEEATDEMRILGAALENNMTRQEVLNDVINENIYRRNLAAESADAATYYQDKLNESIEEARTQLLNLGTSEERVNELLSEYVVEADNAEQSTVDLTGDFQFMADLLHGELYSGLENINTSRDTLSDRMAKNSERIEDLINKSGELSKAETAELRSLTQKNDQLQGIIDKRTEIANAEQEQTFDVSIGSADMEGDFRPDEEAIRQREQQRLEAERQNRILEEQGNLFRTVGTESKRAYEVALEGSKGASEGLMQEVVSLQQVEDATIQASAAALSRGDTAREMANEFIQQLQAQLIAIAIKKALESAPFPLNIALAAGAAAAAKGLFSLIPEFQEGGIPKGPSHAAGGMIGVIDDRPAFEFEAGEAIINRRSTAMFTDELSAINQAGGGRQFRGARMQNGGRLGPLPSRLEGSPAARSADIDTDALTEAVRQGMENANIVARLRDSIADLDDKLSTYRDEQTRIGN